MAEPEALGNGGREPDPDPGALARRGLQGGLAAVRLRYGRDDGEAQPASPAVTTGLPVPGHPAGTAHATGRLAVPGLPAGPFGTSIEAVECAGRVTRGHAGPGVGDLEHDTPAHLRQ